MKKLFVLSLLLGTTALAQQDDIMFSPFWDFYSQNRLDPAASGRGYTGMAATGDIASTLLNPASLSSDTIFRVAFSYHYKSNVPWLESIWPEVGQMQLKTLHPCLLIGIDRKFSDRFSIGLTYYDRYSYSIDEGNNWYTGPNGELLGVGTRREDIRTGVFSIPAAVTLGPAVRLGLSADFLMYHHVMHYRSDFTSTTSNFNLRFGIIVGAATGLSLGACFEPACEGRNLYVNEGFEGSETGTGTTVIRSPARLGLGIKYRFETSPVSLYCDINQVWTSWVDYTLKDRQDFSFGTEYEMHTYTARAGFFTIHDYRIASYYSDLQAAGNDHQYFMTLGVTVKNTPVPVTIGIMDSHALSTGRWKTTCFTVGVNWPK